MLVEDGKLTWDKPVRESVPTIQFYNDALNATVTLRDMLSHRTGITRHDMIWYQSRRHAKAALRQVASTWSPRSRRGTLFLYNNMMFAAAGLSDRAPVGEDAGKTSFASASSSRSR